MSRPGFVLEVDERTPPLLIHEGEGFRLEPLPLGTKVIYPPDSLPGIRQADAAIRRALLAPEGMEPLPELLSPGMRLTIVFDDISLPLPQMRTPDIRQRIIEQVLELAAAAGVDDVELIAANSLHRRMTPAELRRAVGDRVFRAFYPDHLRNHDAEDRANLVHFGKTGSGEDVEINRRAAESDLVVYVNITLTAMSGGPKSVSVGLGSYRSLHTTVFAGDGGIVEIQIRTKDMHDEAQYGIASHVYYKERTAGNETGRRQSRRSSAI